MSSISPGNALTPRVMLATGIHAQPGVYALLLGSGVSRSAGISTGWEIVSHLVQKVAAAADPDNAESHALAQSDPEAWWAQRGEGDLGYSSLLAAIAPSSAARQGLLAEYFEASEEDRASGMKVATAAHAAIAQLVKDGWVKVIVTTNFDRLMEQALDAVGIAPQVISRPDAVGAATPLAHANATIVKLHGDWKDLEFRNTLDELDTYPQPWIELVRQVCNEYGLLISGWSAEWDKALVGVLESTPRRYPLYWDSRSSKSAVARNLLAQHGGHMIPADSADQLFASLTSSVEALTRLAEPPLSTAMAVTRLKRAMPDPLRRIELQDLLADYTNQLVQVIPGLAPSTSREWSVMDAYLDEMLAATTPLMTLLVNGVRYDDGTHTRQWIATLQRLLDRSTSQPAGLIQTVDELRNYPALLALRAMSVEAVHNGKDDVLVALLTRPHWDDPLHQRRSTIAADVLHLLNVIDNDFANGLPRWEGQRWVYPSSHLLKSVLIGFFADDGIEYAAYRDLCHDVEYRTGLAQFLLPSQEDRYRHNPNSGEFVHDDSWQALGNNWDNQAPRAEIRFLDHIARCGSAAWNELLGERDVDQAVVAYRDLLKSYTRR